MKYGHLLKLEDLSFANERVGDGFVNSLPQNFIILNEDDRHKMQDQEPSTSCGTKRKASDSGCQGRGGRGGGLGGGDGAKRSK